MHSYELSVETEVPVTLILCLGGVGSSCTGPGATPVAIQPSPGTPDWCADLYVDEPDDSGCGTTIPGDEINITSYDVALFLLEFSDPSSSDVLARYAYALQGGGGPGGNSFYLPPPNNSIVSPDLHFDVVDDAEEGIVAKAALTSGEYFEDVFEGGHYVIPYEMPYFCANGGSGCTDEGDIEAFLSTLDTSGSFGDIDLVSDPDYTFSAEGDAVIHEAWSPTWDLPGLTLRFHPGRELVVNGVLDVDGATLTEATTGQGWGSIGVAATGAFHVTGSGVTIAHTDDYGPGVNLQDVPVIEGTFDVAPGAVLSLDDATLVFAPYTVLDVQGSILAEDSKLTANNSTVGWGGLVVRAPFGSGGLSLPASTLIDTDVEYVGPPSGGAVVAKGSVGVFNRSLVIDDVSAIRNSIGGVFGILASGGAASVKITGESRILENAGVGVVAAAGAAVTVEDASEVFTNTGAGIVATGAGSTVYLDNAVVELNEGQGVWARDDAEVLFANAVTDSDTEVLGNAGGLDANDGGSIDAGRCQPDCDDLKVHQIIGNDPGDNPTDAYFDARSRNGSTLYAQWNYWDVTDVSDLDLRQDGSSVLEVCPIFGGSCGSLWRQAGAALRGAGTQHRGTAEVLALVDEAERARLGGDEGAFAIAADAVVAALASEEEDARRAAFEGTTRLFAWAQPTGPLASLSALAGQEGEGRPWALRALGVAHAFAEDYADARAATDTLATAYAGSEHARFGLALAVRVAVAEEDAAGALAALDALAAAFPEADEVPTLAALVLATFPGAGVEAALSRPAAAQVSPAPVADAAGTVGAFLAVGAAEPNPSVGRAYLPFELATEATVEAVLYDALGRRVALLASGRYGAGRHALALDGSGLPSGVYVAYVTADAGSGAPAVAVRRLTITR